MGEPLLLDNEAGCFYHPGKKAEVPCSRCGRFLCQLCDVELDDDHICPSCLETGKKKRSIKSLENHRTMYDSIALALALYPLLIFWITCITAPMVIFMVIRYWKAPSSIIPRTKIRFISAFVMASIQIAGWTAGLYMIITT